MRCFNVSFDRFQRARKKARKKERKKGREKRREKRSQKRGLLIHGNTEESGGECLRLGRTVRGGRSRERTESECVNRRSLFSG